MSYQCLKLFDPITSRVDASRAAAARASGEGSGPLFGDPAFKALTDAFQGDDLAEFSGNLIQGATTALKSALPTGFGAVNIAIQLAAGADPTKLATHLAKQKAATYVATETTNYIAEKLSKELSKEVAGTVAGAAGPVGQIVGTIAAKAATNQSITPKSVIQSLGSSLIPAPIQTALLVQDIHDMKKSAIKAKRKYEDKLFSAPIASLHPNQRNIEHSTGHPTTQIAELFEPSRPDELNYLGGQLARELDPPRGERFYHGDESTRKLMEKNLGTIQKYRNTIPAYDNIWNQFAYGQISRGQFMVQSQKAVDDYIIGKLGTKVALKPGEVVVSDPRHLHRGALSRPSQIIDLSDESGRLQYYRLTGQPPSG